MEYFVCVPGEEGSVAERPERDVDSMLDVVSVRRGRREAQQAAELAGAWFFAEHKGASEVLVEVLESGEEPLPGALFAPF